MPLPTSITLPSRKEPAEVRRAQDPETGLPVPYTRSLFKTKTALAQYLLMTAGAITAFWPEAVTWVSTHAGSIMIGAGIVNLLIRWITHDRVALFSDAGDA